MSDLFTHDPANYRKMCEPHTEDKANAALAAFYEAIGQARKAHRIADVLVVASMSVQREDGEGRGMSASSFGNEWETEAMAHWACGFYARNRQSRLDSMFRQAGAVESRKHQR